MHAYIFFGKKPRINSNMTKIKGSTVLVTGGASGIGKLIGESCLYKGARRLIIWDVNEQALKSTTKELRSKGHQVHAYKVNVADVADVESATYTILEDIGPVDILFNNAGIVIGKEFVDHTHEDIKRTIDINVGGVMHVAAEFLPSMLARKQGHMVNISSASGMLPNPRMSVYAASKWAVLGWSESLRLEMEREKSGVQITTVTPGYINTGMFDGVKAPLLTPILTPEKIVSQIISSVENDEILLRSPWMVNYLPFLRGILPTRLFDFVAESFGVYDSMSGFKGHNDPSLPQPKPMRKKVTSGTKSGSAPAMKKESSPKGTKEQPQPDAATKA